MTGSTLRILLALCLGPALDISIQAAEAQTRSMQRPAACVGEARPDRLQGLTQEGDLNLFSGQLARLAGIRLPDTSPYREQAITWLKARSGQPALIQGPDRRDRWDRLSVRIRSFGEVSALDWAHGLVEAGLALVDAGQDGIFCQPELLASRLRPANDALVFGPMTAISPLMQINPSACASGSAASCWSKAASGASASASSALT